MAQKRETEETEIKVPETLTFCTPTPTPTVATPPSKNSGSFEHTSDPKSIVDVRPTSANPLENLNLYKEARRSETIDSSDDDKMKRREVNRCSSCCKKVGLMGFRCRCGEMFCSKHRYSDRHNCSYDYKAAGREAIARENPMIRAAKIVKV